MKKVLALLLVVAMTVGIMPTVFAAADPAYGVKFVGKSGTIGSGSVQGITFDMQLKGTNIGYNNGVANICIKVDTTRLMLVRSSNGSTTTITTGTLGTSSLTEAMANASAWTYDPDTREDYLKAKPIHILHDTSSNTLYMSLQPQFACTITEWTDYTSTIGFALAFVGETKLADLDATAIQVVTADEAALLGQGAAAAIPGTSASQKWQYEVSSKGSASNEMGKPIILVDNKELPAGVVKLTGIDAKLDKDTLAVPTKGKTATATASVDPLPSGATAPKDIEYTIPTTTGVEINKTSGVITVSPTASAGTVTVTATSKGDATKTDTVVLTLTKDTPVVDSVAVSPKTVNVTLNANGSAPAQQNATVTVKDQYGNTKNETVTPSGLPSGASWAGNKLTFTTDLRAGTSTVTFTAGTESDTLSLVVSKAAAPAAPNAVGVKTSTVGGNDGKITGVNSTMEWKVNGAADTTYQDVTGTEITGLSKGKYDVRVKATDFVNAGTVKTVDVGEPGKTDTPSVSITAPGVADGKVTVTENGSVVLTATVTPATGTIHYQWKKGSTNVGTDAATHTVAAADAGDYTCVVTRTADNETVSDPATSNKITVEVKTKTPVTVTLKTSPINNFKRSGWTLSDVATIAPSGAASALTADKYTITVYAKTDGKAAVDPVACTCSHKDDNPVPETGHDEGCPYVKGSAAVPASYAPVTTLEAGKTYFVDVVVPAGDLNDTYKVDADKALASKGTITEANENDFLKVVAASNNSGGSSGGGATRYTVTYDAGEHGKLDGASSERVESGKNPTKVPSVVADKGYKFVGWTLNGKSVNPTSEKITKATKFVAEYEAADKTTYIQGMDKNHFQPADNATRGQLATMLARLSKDYDASKTYTGKAPDVENGKWYSNTVNFAINKGIMNGFEDGMFRPTENIRRGEFAAMLARYLGLNTSSKGHFADVTDHWAAGYINALADAGIVNGFEDGTFKANNLLTRAEAVKMINLAVEMKYDEKADYDNSFVDVAKGAWYYEFVMPAANLDVTDYQR